MKLRAFLQALCLFLILVAPVVFFVLSQRKTGTPLGTEPDKAAAPAEPTHTEKRTGQEEEDPATPDEPAEASPVVVDWEAVITGLREAEGPGATRERLRGLRQWLFSMGSATASDEILRFLETGRDLPLGLRFRVGPGGRLAGAPSLRSTLLDWLGQWNPAAARRRARTALQNRGTELPPSEYVLHLRNYAWASPGEEGLATADREFLLARTRALLRHEPWLNRPTPAVAEAVDVVVYLASADLLPDVLELLRPEAAPGLRAAAALGLERLVDRRPMEVLPALLEADLPSVQRAASFARLHAASEPARELLAAYLADDRIPAEEKGSFLDYYPNLNNALSHNLLSAQLLNTDIVSTEERLRTAAARVQRWLANPDFRELYPRLEQARRRLQQQISGKAPP
ncbi:MAG: hypothetical protein GVY10_03780 [Verrucomicrobia bacterium]|jgi:hypothetical protein|nr:hypothetical protein [Verrucomicrobiota bacterium]